MESSRSCSWAVAILPLTKDSNIYRVPFAEYSSNKGAITAGTRLDIHSLFPYSTKTRYALSHRLLRDKGFNGSHLHLRALSVLLSGWLCAGVYCGLDSDQGFKNPVTHPPDGVVGFLFAGDRPALLSDHPSTFQCAPVAKWPTRGSAKPVFAGSIPARRSNFLTGDQSLGDCKCRIKPPLEKHLFSTSMPLLSHSPWPCSFASICFQQSSGKSQGDRDGYFKFRSQFAQH
jgi:hypothetical protein